MKRISPLFAAALLLLFGAPASAETVLGSAEYTITIDAAATDPCEEGPIGAVCMDGAVYAGQTVGGTRFYMAPANEPVTYQFKVENTASAQVANDGLLNTILLAEDEISHPAAEACLAKGPGWFLPSRNELSTITSNRWSGLHRYLAPSSVSSYVWESTGTLVSIGASSFVSGSSLTWSAVRCVRVGSASTELDLSLTSFASIPSALPDQLVSSGLVYVKTIRSTTPVSVSVAGEGSPELSISGGPFVTSGSLRAGDTLRIRLRSAVEIGFTRTAQITIGGQVFTFDVTTLQDCRTGEIGSICEDGTVYVADNANGERIFLSSRDESGTYAWKTSNTVSPAASDITGYPSSLALLEGLDADRHAAAAVCAAKGPGWYLPSIDDFGRIRTNGPQLPAETNISTTVYWSSSSQTDTQALVTRLDQVWSLAASKAAKYSVRCAREAPPETPSAPAPFSIQDVPFSERDVLVTSSPTRLYGTRSLTPSLIVVSGDGSPELSVEGGEFGPSGFILDGQDFVVRLRSASGHNETRTATVTINGVSETFIVTTSEDCETGPVGTRCADGAFYAGYTRDGTVRFYVSPSFYTASTWKQVATSTPGTASLTDGLANTVSMMRDQNAHAGAKICAEIGFGWFLLSEDELVTAGANLSGVSGSNVTSTTYMSSTEVSATQFRVVNPVTGARGAVSKTSLTAYRVMCGRLGDEGGPGLPALAFADLSSAAPDVLITSGPSTLTGLTTRQSVPVSVSGEGNPEISIAGGPFVTSGMARIHDQIRVRMRTATDPSVTRSATVSVGPITASFSVTTGSCETGPIGSVCSDGAIYAGLSDGVRFYIAPQDEPYTLRWKTELSATSGATSLTNGFANTAALMQTPHLYPAAAACRARGEEWYLPSGGEMTTVYQNVDLLSAAELSGDVYWTSTKEFVSVSVTSDRPVRCARTGADATSLSPSPFVFVGKTRPFDSVVNSNQGVLDGLRDLDPRPITVSGEGDPQISVNGGEFATSGMIRLGQSVIVRMRSAPDQGGVRTAIVTVAGVESTFTLTSGPDCRSGPIGTICEDDAIYAGTNSLGARMYVAPSDEGSFAVKVENSLTPGVDGAIGFSDTAVMVTDSVSHPAALACRARGPQWYLPSDSEMRILNTNRTTINAGFGTGFYWTSTESTADRTRQVQLRFGGSTGTSWTKATPQSVRCVRAEPGANVGTAVLTGFTDKTFQEPGLQVEAGPILLTGLITSDPLQVSVSGVGDPQVSINGGDFAPTAQMSVGDRLVLRVAAPIEEWTARSTVVTVGALNQTFTVTSGGDCRGANAAVGAPCPDGSVFAGVNGPGDRMYMAPAAEPSTYPLRSNAGVPIITTSTTDGYMNTLAMLSVSGTTGYAAAVQCASRGLGWYLPSQDEFNQVLEQKASLSSRVTFPSSDPSYHWASQISATGTGTGVDMSRLGSSVLTNSVTSLLPVHCFRLDMSETPQPPRSFPIAGTSFAQPDQLVSSGNILIGGIRNLQPVPITVIGDGAAEVSVEGGAFTTSGTIDEGGTFVVRLRSSAIPGETRSAIVTVNGVSETYSVRTSPPCDTSSEIGSVCADGAIFAGVNAEGHRFYLASENEPSNIVWKSSATSTSGTSSLSDGFMNTAVMARESASALHPAAAACRARGPEWYLPSSGELGILYTNIANLGHAGLANMNYWSSTEASATTARVRNPFSAGSTSTSTKTAALPVRCVRTGFNELPVAPSAFSVSGASGAPGEPLTSAEIIPTGFRSLAPVDVFVSGNGDPTFSIDGGPFVVAGQLVPGQPVKVRVNAPTSDWSSDSVTLTFDAGSSARSGTFPVSSTGSCEHPSAPLGWVCSDGAIYAGVNTNGHRFYLAPTNEVSTRAWKTASNSTPSTSSLSDGFMNTAVMAKEAAAASHPAAAACRARGSEWYLPSRDELGVVYTNRGSLGGAGLTNTNHWTSTESAATTARIRNPLSSTSTSTSTKTTALAVRCVRTGQNESPAVLAAFTIPDASGSPGTAVSSVEIIPTGFRSLAPVDVSVSGNGSPTFSIEGGPFVTSGQLIAGQTVRVRANAPVADWSSDTVTLTLDASGTPRSATFTVSSTGACDHPSATIGTVCADGARYAGLNAAGQRFYIAESIEPTTLRWKTATTSTTGATSTNNGLTNTNAMITAGIALHPAAQACVNRGADWYLPSPDELLRISNNRTTLGGPFPISGTVAFWSSQQSSTTSGSTRRLDGTTTTTGSTSKTTALRVLCVRN